MDERGSGNTDMEELAKLDLAVVVLVGIPDEVLHLLHGDVEPEGHGEEEVELGHREVTILVDI